MKIYFMKTKSDHDSQNGRILFLFFTKRLENYIYTNNLKNIYPTKLKFDSARKKYYSYKRSVHDQNITVLRDFFFLRKRRSCAKRKDLGIIKISSVTAWPLYLGYARLLDRLRISYRASGRSEAIN